MQRHLTLAAVVATGLALPAAARAAARAELRPGTALSVGTPAQLAVTTDGDAPPPPPPRIDGATVRFAGQMSQTRSINGTVTPQSTFSYAVVPTRPGALDIPAIAIGNDTTAPIHATVTDAPAPPPATAAAAPSHAPSSGSSRAFLTVDLPSKALVVGQAVPIHIHAYFRGGTSATLEGAPHLTSDAFTLSNLSDKPAQAQIELRGEPYLAATWTAMLSPAKPSSGKLGVELPIELAYRAAPPPRPARAPAAIDPDDPFSDPFFTNPFGGADPFSDLESMFDVGPMQREQTTLHASSGALAVTDLPEAGKPASFTGAVGQFAVALDPIAGTPRVGEPLTLAIRVTGTGNFDRVALTGVDDTPDLHAYPTKSNFTPSAASALTGTKTFTQTVVPTKPGDLVIPALGFAYFDPSKHAYVTVETTPGALHVAAAAGSASSDPGLAPAAIATAPSAARVGHGTDRATLVPLVRQPRVWWIPGGLIALTALLVGGAWWRRSPRIAHVLHARRVHRAVSRATLAMDRAASAHDRAAFFAAARSALQTRLGETWRTAPEAITAHDVETRLGAGGAEIRAVLERADALHYGNPLATDEPLDHWRTVVRGALAHLETAS
ncbi:MAG TPA: BatD family protein [Kofleriaceae bacterium]|nr:BatD family protein [Kofleriaceae bacterium]